MTILFLVPSIILTVKRFSSRCPWILANTVIEGLHCLSLVLIAICPLKHKPLSRSSNIFIKVILVISMPYVLISWYVMEREREHERAIEERRRYKEVLFKTTFNSVSNTLADAKDTVEENMANAEKLMADTDDMHVEESWTNNEYNEKMAHIDSQLTDLANTVAKLQTLASQMIKLRN
ncbi:hypothetical protein AQUCO_02600167v1 [Aquilegia coerulea]|uniref:Uncharacterized protein n=1 Tax=Aquilegia coerulea TaxID=218851 RepID=A0A2G5D7M7_AQUCA|nr:hypothetical protein AQUCO_02600167v1 [Aquilegia coerulea]